MVKGRALDLPLHTGHAPRWLFDRMVRLGGAILEVMVEEFGPEETLRRLAHPIWFQSLGCVLGFDWHSSGLTTTVTGALKEALKQRGHLNLYVAGGKGRASRKTPDELRQIGEKTGIDAEKLVKISRLTAKVDSVCLQDGFQLYHHTFWVTSSGGWAVVQQGMNAGSRMARRYHWLWENVKSFSSEPHSGIVSEVKAHRPLNLVHRNSSDCREVILNLTREKPESVVREITSLPGRHTIDVSKDIKRRNLWKVLTSAYEMHPGSFDELLLVKGLGPETMRALALTSEVIFGAPPAYEDPALYSFAHGGKDGTPYPVRRDVYDKTISVLERGIKRARCGRRETLQALKRLARMANGPLERRGESSVII